LDYLFCRIVWKAVIRGRRRYTVNIPTPSGYTTPEDMPVFLASPIDTRGRDSDEAAVIWRDAIHDSAWRWATRWPASAGGARHIECTVNGSARGQQCRRWKKSLMAIKCDDVVSVGSKIDIHHADAGVENGVRTQLVPGAVQQGDRRPQCVRA